VKIAELNGRNFKNKMAIDSNTVFIGLYILLGIVAVIILVRRLFESE